MTTRLKTLFAITTAGLLFAGLGTPALAQDLKDAPLVSGLKDLRTLSKQLVGISLPSAAATISLVSNGGGGAGSGVVVSEDGLILTAAHVVASLADEVIVIFPDGVRKKAKKLGGDYDRDAAMVQITEEGKYPYVKVGKSNDLLRNEWCVALGHPGGFDPTRTPPVRLGRVLSSGRFITTDCAVVGGDSGGPLFDVEGKVIGIHSNIGATLTENRHVPIGVYLEKWEDIKGGKETGRRFAARGQRVDPNRAVLGVNLADPGADGGVHLASVMEGSPAASVGLQAGDLVTRINGDAVNSAQELIRAVGEFKAGDELKISYLREGKKGEVNVELARLGDFMEAEPERRGRSRRGPRREREEAPREEGGKSEPKEAEENPEPKEEPKEKPEKEKDEPREENADAKDAIKDLLEKALKDGQLQLDDEQLKKLGGMKELRRMIDELAETLGPEALREMLRTRGEPDLFFASSMEALAPVTAKAAKSTVTVLVDGKPRALGTVVSKEGHILTKNTETKKGAVTRKVGDKKVPLELVKRFPKRDLALFKGSPKGLEPVRWARSKKPEPIGTLLTASDSAGEPLGIGLVSVLTRALGNVGFLGIQAGEAEGGVRIVRTVNGSPAKKVGLQADDVITHIDGKEFDGPIEFGNRIRTYRAGDEVEFTYRRDDKESKIKVKLAARSEAQGSGRFQRMNEMSGPLSARLTGFPEALQHDIPISPAECGGPLLDLNGRCVGINVSRAGRVKTLAVPVSDVLKLLSQAEAEEAKPRVVAEAKPANPKPDEAALMKQREKVLKELRDVEGRLKEVEKQLERLKK
jgi:serine protease Do